MDSTAPLIAAWEKLEKDIPALSRDATPETALIVATLDRCLLPPRAEFHLTGRFPRSVEEFKILARKAGTLLLKTPVAKLFDIAHETWQFLPDDENGTSDACRWLLFLDELGIGADSHHVDGYCFQTLFHSVAGASLEAIRRILKCLESEGLSTNEEPIAINQQPHATLVGLGPKEKLPHNKKQPIEARAIALVVIRKDPQLTYSQLAKELGCSAGYLKDKRHHNLRAAMQAVKQQQQSANQIRRGSKTKGLIEARGDDGINTDEIDRKNGWSEENI